jgi:phosphoglycolate phosphatase
MGTMTIQCESVSFANIAAVIFDKDGTLAHSEMFLRNLAQKRSRLIDAQIPGVQEPLLMAFGVDGDRLNPAGLMAIGTRQENEIAAAAYVAETGRDWIESLQRVRAAFAEADQYMLRKADQTPLVAGAIACLQILSQAGVKLGILSSDSPANVEDFVNQNQLTDYFQLQMGTDGSLSKPDPRLLQQACAALEVSPAQVLIVGDSEADVQLARAGAAGCIGVTGGWTRSPHLSADVLTKQLSGITVRDNSQG